MKALLLLLLAMFLSLTRIQSKETQTDRLKSAFAHSSTEQERAKHCLNLDNYYRNVLQVDSLPLTQLLLNEGIKAKNEYIISDALRKLVMSVDRKRRVLTNDSIIYYLKLADEHLTGQRQRSFITEVRLRHIRSMADWATDEIKVIEELTTQYANPSEREDDAYFMIERNYALGMASALGISDNGVDAYKNTLRYFDSLFDLIQKLPIEYGAELLFWVNENIYLSYINSKSSEKAVAFLENMMKMLNAYKEVPDVKADVYQDFAYVYSLYNEGLAYFPSIVGRKKASVCLQKVDEVMRKRGDLISLYFAYKGFYDDLKDHQNIILYADSIVAFMKSADVPVAESVISHMYKTQAACYAALKDYETAYKLMQQHDALEDEITNGESKQLRADMDARYDLNHLELEQERLISRNRQVALFSIGFVFLLSVGWGISQRFHLQKLRRMQKKLVESNKEVVKQSQKAQESEKMKTAFINSMCHEIRTPLNSINGFSSLLLDESIDADCKEDFPALIQQNTDLLTRLLNDMLEVSNLSSSAEELPTAPTDLHAICTEEMEKLTHLEGKAEIHYHVDVPANCLHIHTHALYLSQTIAHLLNNANKFTKSGQITLSCCRTSDNQLEVRVTDTGIGIPADKREVVFERFAKLDDFKAGAGLGLYICRLIVTRLGGTIEVDAEHEQGASFVIRLLG